MPCSLAVDVRPDYGSCWTVGSTVASTKHTLTATAYDADGGRAYQLATVWRDVQASPPAGPNPPSVTLTRPAGGTTFGDILCPTASASDDARVTRVRFYLDSTLRLTDYSPPYGNCVSTATVAAGNHTLYVRADDADGGSAGSRVIVTKLAAG